MLNIAFCDDDKDFLERIAPEVENAFRHLRVETHGYTFKNGADLIASFSKYQPYYDVVFLDIDMPGKDGEEVAKELRLLDKKFKLVFVTAYPQEAPNTFQYDVIGFLPKDQITERLAELAELIINRIHADSPLIQMFEVSADGVADIRISLDDIIYFECISREVFLHTKRGIYKLHHDQFSDIIKKYLPLGFADIHRTCIVNLKYIFSVDEAEVRLDDGTRLPLSRRKRQPILDRLSEIISGDDERCQI